LTNLPAPAGAKLQGIWQCLSTDAHCLTPALTVSWVDYFNTVLYLEYLLRLLVGPAQPSLQLHVMFFTGWQLSADTVHNGSLTTFDSSMALVVYFKLCWLTSVTNQICSA